MPKFRHRLAAAGVATFISLPAALVSAAPPVIEHWQDAGTEEFTFCPNLENIEVSFDFRGSVRIVKRGKNGLQYFTETFRGTVVWTNLDNGRTLRLEQAGVDKDIAIVDNGDGTLSIIVLSTGTARFYDTNGRLVLTNNGQIRFELLVDHNGTPNDYTDDPDAEFIGVTRPSNGTNDTEGRDFCDDLALFIG